MAANRVTLRPSTTAFEHMYAAIVVFLSANTLVPFLRGTTSFAEDAQESGLLIQAVWLTMYVLAVLLFAFGRKRPGLLPSIHPAIWLLTGLAILSISWSENPSLTIQRSAALLGTTVVGIHLASRYALDELAVLLARLILVIGVISAAFVVLAPEIGLDPYWDTAWRGIFVHKNSLGRIMSLGAIIWLLRLWYGGHRHIWTWIGASVCVLATILSQSGTSLIVLGTVLLTLVVFGLARMNGGLLGITLMSIGVSIPFGAAVLSTQVQWETFDANLFLTGRIDLWRSVWDHILQRPWLGYGYDAVWGGEGPLADRILWRLSWDAPHSHNGFLELLLAFGIIGGVIFLWLLVANFAAAWNLFKSGQGMRGSFAMAFLMWLVLVNVTESSLVVRNSIFWLIFVAVTVDLGWRRQRTAARQPQTSHTSAHHAMTLRSADGDLL